MSEPEGPTDQDFGHVHDSLAPYDLRGLGCSIYFLLMKDRSYVRKQAAIGIALTLVQIVMMSLFFFGFTIFTMGQSPEMLFGSFAFVGFLVFAVILVHCIGGTVRRQRETRVSTELLNAISTSIFNV